MAFGAKVPRPEGNKHRRSRAAQSRLDQRKLGGLVSLYSGTLTTLLARMEQKRLIRRSTAPNDRRRRDVAVTAHDRRIVKAMSSRIDSVQERLLAPLSVAERRHFEHLLKTLIDAHSGTSTTKEQASSSHCLRERTAIAGKPEPLHLRRKGVTTLHEWL